MTDTHELRSQDLVAKIARVTLPDTVRVMLAVELVSWFLEQPELNTVTLGPNPLTRATKAQAEACERVYADLVDTLAQDEGDSTLDTIRSYNHLDK